MASNITPSCQICGMPLEVAVVRCGSCHTPHHKDCWDYLGGCSTYGCAHSRTLPDTGTVMITVAEAGETGELGLFAGPTASMVAVRPPPPPPLVPSTGFRDEDGCFTFSPAGAQLRPAGRGWMEVPAAWAVEWAGDPAYRPFRGVPLFFAGFLAMIHHPLAVGIGILSLVIFALLNLEFRDPDAFHVGWIRKRPGRLEVEVASISSRPGGGARVLRHRKPHQLPDWFRVTLDRTWTCVDPEDPASLLQLTYRLQLCQIDPRLQPVGEFQGPLITPGISVPRKPEARPEFLEELSRVRALGRLLAEAMGIPYHESAWTRGQHARSP